MDGRIPRREGSGSGYKATMYKAAQKNSPRIVANEHTTSKMQQTPQQQMLTASGQIGKANLVAVAHLVTGQGFATTRRRNSATNRTVASVFAHVYA